MSLEDHVGKTKVHKKHKKRKSNDKYLEKDGTIVGDFQLGVLTAKIIFFAI